MFRNERYLLYIENSFSENVLVSKVNGNFRNILNFIAYVEFLEAGGPKAPLA